MISLTLYLLSVLLFGSLGGWLAGQAKIPVVIGVLVGAVFSLIGVVFLAGVWLAEWVVDAANRATK